MRVVSIVQGRKHCPRCGCWRYLATDFGILRQRTVDGSPRFQSWCYYCQRLAARARKGYGVSTNGKPGPDPRSHCGKGHYMGGDNLYIEPSTGKRICRVCRSEFIRSPKQREYQRIYQEAKRREAGVEARRFVRETPRRNASLDPLNVPAEPFRSWLEEQLKNVPSQGVGAWAIRHHVGRDWVYKTLNNKHPYLSIDHIDRVFTARGEPWMLEELYPSESEVAA